MWFYAWSLDLLEASVVKKWTISTKYPNVILVTQWRTSLKGEQDIPDKPTCWQKFVLNAYKIFGCFLVKCRRWNYRYEC